MNEREIKSIKEHIKTTKDNIFATFKVECISNLVICYEQLQQENQQLKEQNSILSCQLEEMRDISFIQKPSYDITDLVEVGDVLVVGGIKYTVLQDKEHCNNILYIKTINNHYSTIGYLFEQNIIESIVTKEQFEREAYKI